jgi:hypothetical protein
MFSSRRADHLLANTFILRYPERPMSLILVIIVIFLLLGGGGFYGRGRWW